MINSSFMNIPLIQDQVSMDVRRTCPLPVEEAIKMEIYDDQEEMDRMQKDL